MTTALLCVVCVLSLNVLIDVATAIPTHHLKGQGGRDIEFTIFGRQRRASTTVVGAFLKTARIVHSSEWFRLYKKPGGNKQALKDLRSLHPKHIDDFGLVKWAEIESGITSRTVRVEELMGQTTLTIWRKTTSKSGAAKMSIDKVIYTQWP